MSGQNVELYKR